MLCSSQRRAGLGNWMQQRCGGAQVILGRALRLESRFGAGRGSGSNIAITRRCPTASCHGELHGISGGWEEDIYEYLGKFPLMMSSVSAGSFEFQVADPPPRFAANEPVERTSMCLPWMLLSSGARWGASEGASEGPALAPMLRIDAVTFKLGRERGGWVRAGECWRFGRRGAQ